MDIKRTYKPLLVQYRKRETFPFVVEVLGTPNSGKTSAIQAAAKIFNRNGVKCKVIYEGAEKCPIQKKLSPEFNLWTLCETVRQLLVEKTKEHDIVIVERGLMDALCWFDLYYHSNQISKEEYRIISDFVKLKRLTASINSVFIFSCSIEESLKRESLSNIGNGEGSIVNKEVLNKYNSSLSTIDSIHSNFFKCIERIDTSHLQQDEISFRFFSMLAKHIHET